MKSILFTVLFVLFGLAQVKAQYISSITQPNTSEAVVSDTTDTAFKFANTITVDDLRKHLTIIASDEFEGRETGEPGNDKASAYIAGELKRIGIQPLEENSYFQKVDFEWISWEEVGMFVGQNRYKHLWDFLAFPDQNQDLDTFTTKQVTFLGYGIDDPKYSDYKKRNLKNKVIMVYEGEPKDENGNYLISGTKEASEWSSDPQKKLALAREKGVKAVLIISADIKSKLAENRRKLLSPTVIIGDQKDQALDLANSAYISTTIAKDLMGKKQNKVIKAREKIEKKAKSKKIKLKSELQLIQDIRSYNLDGNNILAYIEGEELKDELVIVSAHYDHVGTKGDDVYNGADDNGSGTTAILEIAEAFAKAKQAGNGPKRSVLFLWLTGEEKGLLGSEYYTKYPVFPLEKTVCDINIDMVGRVDKKYEDNPEYIYVIGSDRISKDLHMINEEMNQKYTQIVLDYTYNSEQDPNRFYYRSDHYNFAKNGIPSIFFFNGVHEDYHRITDTVDKINFEKMAKITRHIFHLTWNVANRDERLKITNPGKA